MRTRLFSRIVLAAALVCSPAPAFSQTLLATFEGKPTFKEGDALGYFIWHDGDTWKVRWMTFGAEHKFSGRVVVEGGEIKSFKAVDVDKEREVIRPGHKAKVARGPRGRVVGVRPGRGAVIAEKTLDKIEQESETVVQWQTKTTDDLDGLDIKLTDNATGLRFTLLIDGKPHPQEVEVGKSNFKPATNPVHVRIRP